jgi:hypothetical protein
MLENVPSPADREISLEATLCAIVAITGVARVLEIAGFERATLAVLGLGVIVSAGLTMWHLACFRRFHRKQAN